MKVSVKIHIDVFCGHEMKCEFLSHFIAPAATKSKRYTLHRAKYFFFLTNKTNINLKENKTHNKNG